MRQVGIVRVRDDVEGAFRRLIELLGIQGIIEQGDRVLLKPNLHEPRPWATGATTNPELVAAAIRWAGESGAREVIVGDGPYYGVARPLDCFEATGMAKTVEAAGARWVLFGEHEFRIFRNASPDLPKEIGISHFVLDCDKVINLAVLKTHIDCLVTLGMKNLKGCVRDQDKRRFHETDVDRAVAALSRLIRVDLTLIDGSMGMEGLGPGSGTPAHAGLLLGSRDLVATDVVACAVMGIEADEVRMLKTLADAGLADIELDNIQVIGEQVDAVRRRFQRPHEVLRDRFPNLTIRSQGACSGCTMSLCQALQKLESSGRNLPATTVVMGAAAPAADAIFVGKCTSQFWKGHPHVSGCPPQTQRIKKLLAKRIRQASG